MASELPKEIMEKVYEAIEVAKRTGKIRKGTNEVTKAVEKGNAKLVAIASDVNPPEIIMHLPLLSKEKGVPCAKVGQKTELGAAAGLTVGTTAVAIVGEGEAKKLIKEIAEAIPSK
ncbi:MAG: 50S ribosomal protein L7Ae [Nanoarchaeota archaeon]|nr:50S ribosomal protein L7Ae [Nanoarchaeota archaeon]